MTQQMVEALSDAELEKVQGWIEDERKMRKERHKQETIAKIRALAKSIDRSVKIEGTRGRPAGNKKLGNA